MIEALAAILTVMAEPALILDRDDRIVGVNLAFSRLSGFDNSELVGQLVDDLVPENARTAVQETLARVRREQITVSAHNALRMQLRTAADQPLTVAAAVTSIQIEGESYLVCGLRDLGRRTNEAALFRGLLDSAPDAMIVCDEIGSIVMINDRAEHLLACSRAQLIGRPVEVLVPQELRGFHAVMRHAYGRNEQSAPMVVAHDGLLVQRLDGTSFPGEISLAPIQTPDGTLFAAAVRDLTERRRIQKEADRVKDEFFANVTHELRTPLTSILGYAELLADIKTLEPRAADFVEIIRRSAERELRLVSDLLTMVNIAEVSTSLQKVEVDLCDLVAQVGLDLAPAAARSGIVLKTCVPAELIVVHGDPDRLSQALDNVVTNAFKFTPAEGEVSIEVHVEGRACVIRVKDTGVGFGDTDPELLFDRLYRAENAREQHKPGTGLGLAITRAIIEAHQGSVTAFANAEGPGSTFELRLPLIRRRRAPRSRATSRRPAASPL